MKKVFVGTVLSTVLAFPLVCSAADTYVGVQYGTLTSEDSDMGNAGLMVGGKINDYLSLEGLYTFTVSEEDLGDGDSLSASSIGLFAAFKSEGDFYGKAKIGFSKVDFDMEIFGVTLSDDASGLAYGFGGGVKLGKGALEIEYTKLPELDTFVGIPIDASNEFISIGYVVSF